MLYYVMNGTETIAICTRAADAHALAGYSHEDQKYYQVVAKLVDTAEKDAILKA